MLIGVWSYFSSENTFNSLFLSNISDPPDVAIALMNEDPHDIILKCLADGEPPNYTFDRWIHIAPDQTTEIQRYTGNVKGGENMLVLKNATYMDSGYYICNVSNGVSTSTTPFGTDRKEISVAGKNASVSLCHQL